jgi:hypothetical protein
MRMTRRVDVRAGFVNLTVDRKGGGIDGFVANDDVTIFVHEDEVRDADLGEVFAQWVQPEVVAKDRIADGDVAGYTFVETCDAC